MFLTPYLHKEFYSSFSSSQCFTFSAHTPHHVSHFRTPRRTIFCDSKTFISTISVSPPFSQTKHQSKKEVCSLPYPNSNEKKIFIPFPYQNENENEKFHTTPSPNNKYNQYHPSYLFLIKK